MPGIFATTLADEAFSITLPQDSTEEECLEYAKLWKKCKDKIRKVIQHVPEALNHKWWHSNLWGNAGQALSTFQSGVCHSEEGAEPRLNLEKGHCACMVLSKKQKIHQIKFCFWLCCGCQLGVGCISLPQKFQCNLGALCMLLPYL